MSTRSADPALAQLRSAFLAPGRSDSDDIRARFEQANGQIVDAYFCTTTGNMALLLRRTTARRVLPPKTIHSIRMHHNSSLTHPELTNAVPEARILASRYSPILNGKPHEILTRTVYCVIDHLLYLIESTQGAQVPEESAKAKAEAAREYLKEAKTTAVRAAKASALAKYIAGLVLGGAIAFLPMLGLRLSSLGFRGDWVSWFSGVW